jgi:DNA-binding LytR/AlgR family response regulator
MNCLIIDDELTARVILKRHISKIESLNLVGEFYNALQGIKHLNEHNDVDLIFLDIHMPDFNGIDFVKSLKNPPKIILTTGDSKFAIEAFEYDSIVDYLLKPIEFSRFEKAVQKASKIPAPPALDIKKDKTIKQQTSEDNLYVNIDRRLIKIKLDSIYLVEAKGDYIHIKTEEKNYTVHSTLKKLEDKLPDSIFLKIHRSFVINVNKIIDIEDNSVLIKKDVVPISRSNRTELMRRLNLL